MEHLFIAYLIVIAAVFVTLEVRSNLSEASNL